MRNTSFLILAISSLLCRAQAFKVQFGVEKDDPKKTATVGLLHADNSKVFVLKHEIMSSFMFGPSAAALTAPFIDKYYINQFNQNLVFSKKIPISIDNKNLMYLDLYFHNNHFLLFGVKFDKETGNAGLYISNMDINGKAKTAGTPICEYSNVKANWSYTNLFDIRASRDSSKYVIIGKEKTDDDSKAKFDNAIVTVIDDAGNKLWTRNMKIANTTTQKTYVEIADVIVSNAGDVFALVKQYLDGTNKQKTSTGAPNYKHTLYAYLQGGTVVKSQEISLGEHFSGRPELVQTRNGEVIAAGLLSEKKSGNFVGFYTLKADNTLGDASYNKLLFNSEQIATNGSRLKYTNDEISENFAVDEIIDLGGGSYGISAEYYNYNNAGNSTTQYYRDILFCTVGPDNALRSVDVIPKNQISVLPVGFSYKVIAHKGQPYFLFNDNIDNVGKSPDEIAKLVRAPKNYTAVICYKEGDNWQRKLLFSQEDAEGNYLLPEDIQQTSENTFILPCEKKGNQIFAKLTFTP